FNCRFTRSCGFLVSLLFQQTSTLVFFFKILLGNLLLSFIFVIRNTNREWDLDDCGEGRWLIIKLIRSISALFYSFGCWHNQKWMPANRLNRDYGSHFRDRNFQFYDSLDFGLFSYSWISGSRFLNN